MNKLPTSFLLFFVWSCGICLGAHAQPEARAGAAPLSDAVISRSLIGTWSVPSSSPDYERDKYSIEIYKADGTNITVWYTDATCKKVAHQIAGKWLVKDGWLISFDNIFKFKDKILKFEAGKVFILDDSPTHIHSMQRGTFCGDRVS